MKNLMAVSLNTLNSVASLFLLIFAMSCIDEVNPKGLLNTDRKVVINSFISPQDTLISVQVSLSRPAIGIKRSGNIVQSDLVTNAEVTLSDGTNSIAIPISSGFPSDYSVSADLFPIKAGQEYFLEVKYDKKSYKASCIVPKTSARDISATVNKTAEEYELQVFWEDPEGEENYYRMLGDFIYKEKREFFTPDDWMSFSEGGFKKDDNVDGQVMSVDAFFYENQVYIDGVAVSIIDSVSIQVRSTDKNYYEYQKKIFEFDFIGNGSEDPFAEPTTRFVSNIEGDNALGIFAAYQSVTKKIKIPE